MKARFLPAGLVAVALAGCGGSSSTHHRAVIAAQPVAPITAGHLPPTPALLRLRAALRRVMRRAGRHSAASVYDLNAAMPLFTLRDGIKLPPASVEKLYTTVALLRKLGTGARLHTSVLGVGHLGAGGVWHGDLYLRGAGDPTFGDGAFNRIYELGYGPTAAQLAGRVRAAGIRSITGSVIGDASLFDSRPGGPATGYLPDIPDFGGQLSALTYDHGASGGALTPGAFAARALTLALHGAHVQANAATTTGVAPKRARRLATISSPSLSVLLRLMNLRSDDLFAEMLTEQLGVRFAGRGSIAAGARVISRTMHAAGIHPEILDGSGLSRSDRSSPREVIALLRGIWGTKSGNVLQGSLPQLGVNGTARRIARGTPAQGKCVAKTGTLNNVTNLAGYCHSRGHQALAFALFIDGPNNENALKLLGRMAAAIAKY